MCWAGGRTCRGGRVGQAGADGRGVQRQCGRAHRDAGPERCSQAGHLVSCALSREPACHVARKPGASRGVETPVCRVARKPRGAGGSPRWPCRARPAQPRPRGQRCQVCGHRCPSAHSSGVPTDALCSVGPSSCPLSPVRPTAQDVRAKVGTQDVHTHVTSHALSSAGGPEPLPGALGRPKAPRWRNLSPPRWALVAKLDSDGLRWCFGLIAC